MAEDPFYRNAFLIGRKHLGEALAISRPSLNFDCQPRLSDVGRGGLPHLLAGVQSLTELNLANVSLRNHQEVEALVSALTIGKPNLHVLGLSRCQLNQKTVRAIGTLLQRCPLQRLNLEGNSAFLVSDADVDGLTETVGNQGLQGLEHLCLRWCHIQPAIATSVRYFLETCCQRNLILDVQGNRGLTMKMLEGFTELKGCCHAQFRDRMITFLC